MPGVVALAGALCLLAPAVGAEPRSPAAASQSEAAALREEGYAAYLRREFTHCAELFARSGRAAAGVPATAADAWYSAAACAAEAGDRDLAFQDLASAADAGFRGVRQAAADVDLKALQADPRWRSWLDRVRRREAAYLAGVNREVYQMFEEDQADRPSDPNVKVDWSAVVERDRARRQRVLEIHRAGGLEAADDYYHAAMILQHGSAAEDFDLAHRLGVRASELDPTNRQARWLAAAAKDRYLMTLGKPQLYGTQFKRDQGGPWFLYPVDPSITDDERAKWNVPPLAEAKKRAEALNTPPPP
ncbi:MAG TPA: hypothetical protein VHR45_20075 [Thermoanaerobaculia bacterium]|nr:hypothetical protein [Thermoanaerobaculia bacterium]